MLATLTLAAGSAAAGWLLQHAYQHMRYSFYEREDAAMLAPGADPEQRRSWLAAIAPQISTTHSRLINIPGPRLSRCGFFGLGPGGALLFFFFILPPPVYSSRRIQAPS